MEAVQSTVATPPPTSTLTTTLGAGIAWMVENNPTLPNLRGEVLRVCGLFVPDSVPSDGLAAWVQANYVPPAVPATPANGGTVYTVEASYDEQVRGNAAFTATRLSSGTIDIPEADLRQMAEDASSISDFRGMVIDYIVDEESNDGFDGDMESHEYSNEEVTNSDGNENWEYPNLEAVIEQFFRANPTLHPDYSEPEDEDEVEDEDDSSEEDEDQEQSF